MINNSLLVMLHVCTWVMSIDGEYKGKIIQDFSILRPSFYDIAPKSSPSDFQKQSFKHSQHLVTAARSRSNPSGFVVYSFHLLFFQILCLFFFRYFVFDIFHLFYSSFRLIFPFYAFHLFSPTKDALNSFLSYSLHHQKSKSKQMVIFYNKSRPFIHATRFLWFFTFMCFVFHPFYRYSLRQEKWGYICYKSLIYIT